MQYISRITSSDFVKLQERTFGTAVRFCAFRTPQRHQQSSKVINFTNHRVSGSTSRRWSSCRPDYAAISVQSQNGFAIK